MMQRLVATGSAILFIVWSEYKIKRLVRAQYPYCPMVTTTEWHDFKGDYYSGNNVRVLYEIYTLPHQNYNIRAEMNSILSKKENGIHIEPFFVLAAVDEIKGNGWSSEVRGQMFDLQAKMGYKKYTPDQNPGKELDRIDRAFARMFWFERLVWNAMVSDYRLLRYHA